MDHLSFRVRRLPPPRPFRLSLGRFLFVFGIIIIPWLLALATATGAFLLLRAAQ